MTKRGHVCAGIGEPERKTAFMNVEDDDCNADASSPPAALFASADAPSPPAALFASVAAPSLPASHFVDAPSPFAVPFASADAPSPPAALFASAEALLSSARRASPD